MTSEASPQDEYAHTPRPTPDWKESYYFQLYDPSSKIAGLFYISAYPNVPKRDFLVALLSGDDTDVYLNTLPLKGKVDKLSDGRLGFTLVNPNQHWRILFDDGKRYAKLDFRARFPTFVYDPEQAYVKDILEQEHYEQPCEVEGVIRLADGSRHEIYCFGHRDHSWGRRDYASIDEWFWVAAQFSWCAIGLIRLRIGTKVEVAGFMSTDEGTHRITKMAIETHLERDHQTPEGFSFEFTDDARKSWLLKSTKMQTMVYPPRQAKPGYQTSIYEIVSNFSLKGYPEPGYGIAEYLVSRKTA
jgi:hypothetical protein